MEREERKAFERLLDNGYIDYPGKYESDEEDTRKEYGFCYMPIMDYPSKDNDGAYKMMTERYLLKYFASGNRLKQVADIYVLKPYPAVDADALVQSYLVDKDKLRSFGERPWDEIGHERWLVRTVGSIRVREDGEMYYDDSRESREDWVYEQATTAYEDDSTDPLGQPEDGWMWTALFARAIRADMPDPMTLTYSLRRLRGHYKLRIVATADGLGKNGGGLKYQKLMEATGRGSWMKSQVEEIRRRRDEARGVGATAWAEENVAGIERPIAAAFRTSDADDGTAGRAAALFSIALQGGGQCSET